jgi:hypothetical protein
VFGTQGLRGAVISSRKAISSRKRDGWQANTVISSRLADRR